MLFFEELKDIIPNNIAKTLFSFDVKISGAESLTHKKKYEVHTDTKTVSIYLKNLSVKEQRTLKKTIKKSFAADESYLVEESKNNLLERLYQYNDSADNQILDFFKSILTSRDWEALRSSLFLRNEYKKGNSIASLKSDIIYRFGERGNLIANLCSAGYFEETMIPLYNSDQQAFWKYWDVAVDRGITALFVNARMTIAQISKEIKHRINSAKSYGLKSIHIHGIGDNNMANIINCLEKEKSNLKFIDKNIFTYEKLHVIVVEIILS